MKAIKDREKEINILAQLITAVAALIGICPSLSVDKKFLGLNQFQGIVLFVIAVTLLLVFFYLNKKISTLRQEINALLLKLKNYNLYIEEMPLPSIERRAKIAVLNKDLKINCAKFTYIVSNNDWEVYNEIAGIRISKQELFENGYFQTTGSENFIPYKKLECYAYDLYNDPARKHKIKPVLKSLNDFSKRLMIPFLRPLKHLEQFNIFTYIKYPNCMSLGKDYLGANLFYPDETTTDQLIVTLKFQAPFPQWVHVYKIIDGQTVFQHVLTTKSENDQEAIYEDIDTNIKGIHNKVYFFYR